MAEHFERATNDSEPDAQAVAAFRCKAGEGFEDAQQLVFRDADAGVTNIDPDFAAVAAATDQDAPTGRRVPYGVGQQIAENATEQHGIAHDMGIGRNCPDIDAALNGGVFVFMPKPLAILHFGAADQSMV